MAITSRLGKNKIARSVGLFSTIYTLMARTEHSINDALADLLRTTRRMWRDEDVVVSEDTGRLKGTSGQPDILVIEPNVSPVVVETEVLPAVTVEQEAASRLGAKPESGTNHPTSIAVRLPERLRNKYGDALKKDLASATDIEMVLYTGSAPGAAVRRPISGGWSARPQISPSLRSRRQFRRT